MTRVGNYGPRTGEVSMTKVGDYVTYGTRTGEVIMVLGWDLFRVRFGALEMTVPVRKLEPATDGAEAQAIEAEANRRLMR